MEDISNYIAPMIFLTISLIALALSVNILVKIYCIIASIIKGIITIFNLIFLNKVSIFIYKTIFKTIKILTIETIKAIKIITKILTSIYKLIVKIIQSEINDLREIRDRDDTLFIDEFEDVEFYDAKEIPKEDLSKTLVLDVPLCFRETDNFNDLSYDDLVVEFHSDKNNYGKNNLFSNLKPRYKNK